MIIPSISYEASSGGPFFRGKPTSPLRTSQSYLRLMLDINNQGSAQQELYWYMNSNHEQTETYRTGFFGP